MSQQRKTGISEQPESSRFILVPQWLGVAVLVLLLLACLLILMLWRPWYPAQRPVKAETPAVEQADNKDKPTDYQFYDLLPQQKVTPLPSKSLEPPKSEVKADDTKAEQKPDAQKTALKNDANATANTPTPAQVDTPAPTQGQAVIQSTEKERVRFVVYVQRFDNPDDAELLRDKMIKADVSAEVAVNLENDKVWYRVLSGPYDTQAEAMLAQKRLTEHQIQSSINRLPVR